MTSVTLPPSLDAAAAAPLRQELLARLDSRRPMLIDAAAVARAGQACLQVLAAARTAAEGAGLAYRVDDASPALREMAALARLDAVLEPLA